MGPRGEGTFSRLAILQAELFRRSEILVFPVPPRTRWRRMKFSFRPFTDGWAMVVVQFSQPGVAEVWTAAKEGLLEASMGTALAKEVTDFIRENVPASHFLRPCSGKLRIAHPLHRKMIERSMTSAAKRGRAYHLWWHPHNFGRDIDANIDALKQILSHFDALRAEFGMRSSHMVGSAE